MHCGSLLSRYSQKTKLKRRELASSVKKDEDEEVELAKKGEDKQVDLKKTKTRELS